MRYLFRWISFSLPSQTKWKLRRKRKMETRKCACSVAHQIFCLVSFFFFRLAKDVDLDAFERTEWRKRAFSNISVLVFRLLPTSRVDNHSTFFTFVRRVKRSAFMNSKCHIVYIDEKLLLTENRDEQIVFIAHIFETVFCSVPARKIRATGFVYFACQVA